MKSVSEAQGVKLIPVDSEHSAISQVIRGEERDSLSKVIITALGGAFRNLTASELIDVTQIKHQSIQIGIWDKG